MQHLPRLRVLVVQDDSILQKIACNLATCCGMAVRSANGQSPVQVLTEAEGTTDLVLIGWSCLMADDRAALQFLRQAEGMRIPCIVHLSDDDGQKVRQARELGLPAVLPRLFSSQTLQELAMQTAEAAMPAGYVAPVHVPPVQPAPVQSVPVQPVPVQPVPVQPVLVQPAPPLEQPAEAPAAPPARVPVKATGAISGATSGETSGETFGDALGETASDKARRLFAEGREALKAKDLDRAIASFSKILAMRGRFPDACRGLAIAWQRKGDLAKFHHYLNKAAEGYVWRGHNAEAEKLYRDMKRTRCLVVNPYQAVADVVLQRGRADAAIVLYEKAHALDPDDVGLRLALARLCQMLRRDEAALEHVVAILQRDDRHAAAMALYAELAGKSWHAPAPYSPQASLSDGEGVWDVEALAVCEDVGASGPVLFLDGEAPLDISTVAVPPEAPAMAATAKTASKILIVDDEPHIRMLLEETLETLEEEGVALLYAENGEEGLALIKEERPSLVFLDVMMPRMNGFDVCDWVKNKLALDGVYVVMLTAKGQEFDSQRGLESGADVYMTKPFRPSEVLMLARTVLGM